MDTIEKKDATVSFLLGFIAVMGWFAVFAQFYIFIKSNAAPVMELFIRFFSFFTILTNILVAVCCTALSVFPKSNWSKYFTSSQTQTAVTVYIVIVGLIYNTILRFLWQPQGLQWVVDELLHSAIPVLFLGYWLLFVPKQGLQWKDFGVWMIYPLAYLGLMLVRGTLSGFYPYPFLNVTELGWPIVLTTALGMAALFLFMSLLLIGIGKLVSKDKTSG